MNGICVIHRDAPTRRMMPVSALRAEADTWMVIATSRPAENMTTIATIAAKSRAPLKSFSITLMLLSSFCTFCTPGSVPYRAAKDV